jgi:Domain of unknown function (DUF4055)
MSVALQGTPSVQPRSVVVTPGLHPLDPTKPNVQTEHPDVIALKRATQRCRDVVGGTDAVKSQNDLYLPRLSDQPEVDYQQYKDRAQFFNVTSRTVDGLQGLLFRKDPVVVVPNEDDETWKAAEEDCDFNGRSTYDFVRDLAREVTTVGRAGTLIEWSESEARPYFARYSAEAIINWKVARMNDKAQLTLLTLKERTSLRDKSDYFCHEADVQYRVYRLVTPQQEEPIDEAGGSQAPVQKATVVCNVWTRPDKNSAYIKGDDIIPARGGAPLEWIPFVFQNVNHIEPDLEKSPIQDLVDTNISHYQTSADLENGRHICGIPTPWAVAFDMKTDKLVLGANSAWVADDPQAKCGFLEFQGQGLKALEEAMKSKENHMASLGARMLDAAVRGDAEAYETVRLRASGEMAALQRISMSLSQGITAAVQWWWWWMDKSVKEPSDYPEDKLNIQINYDFVSSRLPAQELTALVQAFVAGAISHETLYAQLEAGELTIEGRTFEEEQEAIQSGQLDQAEVDAQVMKKTQPPGAVDANGKPIPPANGKPQGGQKQAGGRQTAPPKGKTP